MCYSPISIINPSKYISTKFRDRYLLQVPCGKCAQCATQKSNEWYFRTYYQSMDCITHGGFVLFDTLTYSNEHLPRLSNFMPVPASLDYPCFDGHHLRKFVAVLRQRCKRKYHSNFSYFVSSEYGTSMHCTHRPHYHCLFFVTGTITPLEFSSLVAELWSYGRTDGIPYKSANYVIGNTFDGSNFAGSLRTCKYVSKYIQKSCKFQREIDFRIDSTMKYIASRMPDEDWLSSVNASRVRQRLKRLCNQFHRQSTQFGASALADIDLANLFQCGTLWMPDADCVLKPIGLPTYYKRKLFFELVGVDGTFTWQPTEDGIRYLKAREADSLNRLADRFEAAACHLGSYVDSRGLADYVLNYRGRFKSLFPSVTLNDRLPYVDYFNYVTPSDKEHVGIGVTRSFCGNNSIGYCVDVLPAHYKPFQFVDKYCYFDKALEDILKKLYCYFDTVGVSKQSAYECKQRLTNLYHSLFSS